MRHDPVTIVLALDAERKAEGDYYVDDEESLNGQFVQTKLVFSDNTLRNEVVDKSKLQQSVPQLEVERIVIMAEGIHQQEISEIEVKQGDTTRLTKQFGTASHTLVVRLPGVVINQAFTIKLT